MIISSKVFGEKVLISRDSLRVIQGLFLLAVVYPLVSLPPPSLPHFKALIKPISLIIGLTPDLLLANFPGGGGGTLLQEAIGDVPLDGVAFS